MDNGNSQHSRIFVLCTFFVQIVSIMLLMRIATTVYILNKPPVAEHHHVLSIIHKFRMELIQFVNVFYYIYLKLAVSPLKVI